ncbi:MAG: purine-nucleoside phosphorylase [Ruminococcaceae bacterium]|nr:purine-nucleoside phosphorylase [Oscillospiraceae bacterium]
MSIVKTPHINLIDEKIGFGKTVLMPGDPLRAKYIAENFLDKVVLVNNIRGVQGYTGYYKGVKISVMASGMGMPSIGIYSYELYKYFGVQNIMRIGSAGAISENVKLRDIVAGLGACTNSNFQNQYCLNGHIAPICDYEMLTTAKKIAQKMNINMLVGNLLSSDTFYDDTTPASNWGKIGCLAVEMEAAALYMTALRLGMRALAVCTISDLVYPPFDTLSATEREQTFTQMMSLALDTAVELDKLPVIKPKD